MSRSDESRKQFETEWVLTMTRDVGRHDLEGIKRICWHFWKASRAELVVELPPISDIETDYSDQGYNICHLSVQEKLKEQGLKFHIQGDIIWAEENGDING
ncbi:MULTISPECIES: hypothetical protein [unclassified Cedecea]|uniref:hypothetical protein n=2 Tax=unclassified Cedecea TaxID=2649846 RepID=UPI003018AA50